MIKKNFNLIILASMLIYILACLMPAYVEARNPSVWFTSEGTEYQDYPGFACLLSGIFLPLGLLFGYWGTAVWLANAYYFTAMLLLFIPNKRHWLSIVFAILSIIVGSTLMFFTLRFVTKDYYCWVVSLLSGYYLWLLSFITLLAGLLIDKLPAPAKRWSSLIYGIGIIPVCICIIVPTFDKGDNSFVFDEESQSLVSNKSLDAIVIDDGVHSIYLKRIVGSDSTIALRDIYSSFAPEDNDATPIKLHSNNLYEIYNATYVRVPQKKIRIEISSDGKAKSVEIPNEDGDNSFHFDLENQCFVTPSYFFQLVIEYDNHFYWLSGKGLKRNRIPLDSLGIYFEESNGSILPLERNHTFIVHNMTHGNQYDNRIKIHLNEQGVVDSSSQMSPKRNGP